MKFFNYKFFTKKDNVKYIGLNLMELDYLLKIAVESEDYEIAVEIRDEIRRRKVTV